MSHGAESDAAYRFHGRRHARTCCAFKPLPPCFSSHPLLSLSPHTHCSEEFKKHKAAAQKFLVPFYREWTQYVEMLESQSPDGQLGQDLGDDVAAAMTDEQRQQLRQLRIETESQFKQQ